MVFWRQAEEEIRAWANSKRRKPLVLRGARQTGKTTLVETIGAGFDVFLSLNMEKGADRRLFENDFSAQDLLDLILLEKGMRRQGRMLLFIDEIQNSPEAVARLRYFYEELPEIYVIAAGSLLEIMMDKKKISFPVGRVEYLYLYPLNFGEFLRAIGEDDLYACYIETPVRAAAHSRLSEVFRRYMFTGGMPEAVAVYAETGSPVETADVYASLAASFADDVSKYADTRREGDILRHVIETAPLQTPDRIKFEHFGNSGYSSRDIGNAMRTLERAMLLYLRYPVTGTSLPLIPDKKLRPHLQYIDSGMLCHAAGIGGAYYAADSMSDVYGGKLAEQVAGQALMASEKYREHRVPLFWTREKKQSSAEVDFIRVFEGVPFPVEVKAGATGKLRSLHSYIDHAENCSFAVRLYSGALTIDELKTPKVDGRGGKPYRLLNLPLYLAGRMDAYLRAYV